MSIGFNIKGTLQNVNNAFYVILFFVRIWIKVYVELYARRRRDCKKKIIKYVYNTTLNDNFTNMGKALDRI